MQTTRHTRRESQLGQTGQNLVRIVIASYFLGVSIGLIPGTTAEPLTSTFLPAPYAEWAGKTIIFATAYLVLIGTFLRLSALFLAVVLFWSSYIANGLTHVEAFWRDLALIGALILTYTQTLPRAERRRGLVRRKATVRRVDPTQPILPRRVRALSHEARRPVLTQPEPMAAAIPLPAPKKAVHAEAAPMPQKARLRLVDTEADPEEENIFRDDPALRAG